MAQGNIPVAILMAWLSPPGFTFLPFRASGGWGGSFFQRGDSHLRGKLADAENGVQQWSWAPFDGLSIGMVSLEFLTGWIVSSVVLGFLCYGLVQLAWGAGHFLRSRKNPGKPSSGKGFVNKAAPCHVLQEEASVCMG
ncbi:MAG: DUF2062 domain-containing protein [Akkermansia muciniphila]